MKFDRDDPKLTAYVLGELDDNERADVESLLESNAEARSVVEEIRETAKLLETELASEVALGLSDGQREVIETKAAEINGRADSSPLMTSSFWRRYRVPLALAASIVFVVGTLSVMIPSVQRARVSAKRRLAMSNVKAIATSSRVYGDGDPNGWSIPVARQGRLEYRLRRVDPAEAVHLLTPSDSGRSAPSDSPSARHQIRLPNASIGIPVGPARGKAGGGIYDTSAEAVGPIDSSGVNGLAMLQSLGVDWFDFESIRHMSLGYEVPFGLRDTRSWEGMDNRQVVAEDQGPFYIEQEQYSAISTNPFLLVTEKPLSTFSIDVDTASYANIRCFLTRGRLPPPDAVRIEEMINYFNYDYPLPSGDDPFSVNVEVAECPWNADHRLARIGIKGWEFEEEDRPPANLVFLIDVSGSMQRPNKLPLLKESLELLVGELGDDDQVAMVVYAGASGLVLESTSCTRKSTILDALDRLQAGGGTNGAAGIQLAYDVAGENFIEGGINRVILATDGDFNVGLTSRDDLTSLIEEKAQTGVFLSVLGFGMGNLKDATLETLADKGNGNYAYIDTLNEAHKVLVEQMGGTLITIAKDVKIQVEFNPLVVSAYRLIGYENRLLADRDFNDDTKDAGEIGAGHTVTAFYEIVPIGVVPDLPDIDPLKYQEFAGEPSEAADSGELMTVKLRYKQPDGDTSKLIEIPVVDQAWTLDDASDDFVFAASVASFGILLRGSQYCGDFTYDHVLEMAESAMGEDVLGYRSEFVDLVYRAIEVDN